jgi:tRNA A-37 threonylcarbamoyl transferase component Bud32
LASKAFRPPLLLDFDDLESIVVLEDVGQYYDLGYWLRDETDNTLLTTDLGLLIGNFIGALHGQTCRVEAFQNNFNNFTIQRERLSGQYSAIRGYLERGRISDADALGQQALDMGHRLQKPGQCLTMGDLWPPSMLVTDDGLRIIDWEFSHFGLPGQDLGHFAAHLWMHTHRATSEVKAKQIQALLDSFFQGYRTGLGDEFEVLFGLQGIRDCAIHFGAEVLARTVGVYQPGYLYDSLPLESPPIREAVQVAAEYIRSPESTEIFATLAG